ncbi:MAG: UDP-glucose/GDP-mannose dehydrogenase family protein [Methanothrix sp.]|uniref:UDP-glucose dehydrogenase family protein n=1 Tax=Methanothrix sp. TaxID=90426 RepID=UPI00198A7C6A|nr:UDP-glucose/GDP-mannose dehydrogenase family protein [Methanothrix sp.]MBC7078977.1 UDP-glucose/GDP-mannose dehydrogenase family protein [Methanothrix sp.]NPU87137.1 UDP-glucose/GDP-mannose dehydrogenase family protein [Methanothrix sp.]
MRIAIIGAGYVGLTTGAALAYLGHHVICAENDGRKLAALRRGMCPIREPGVEEIVRDAGGRLLFTSEISEAVKADVIMIAVGTPSREDGSADLRYVEGAAREVAEAMSDGRRYTVVMKSTVPVGTNRRVRDMIGEILSERGSTAEFQVVSNPEFLSEGQALRDFLYPDRIVVGADGPEGLEIMRRMYLPILEQSFEPPVWLPRPANYTGPPLVATDPASAEMIKYAANAFLALKVSFINEIAVLCEKVGADVMEVARGIGLDPRIGPRFLQAGAGWGGSCFPKDTAALISLGRANGYEMPIVSAARLVNQRQRVHIVDKLENALDGLAGKIVGVMGIAFKPGTDDIRDAPSLDIMRLLARRGARVRAHDPAAMANARSVLDGLDVELCDDPYLMADGADALLLVTEWPEYKELDLNRIAGTMRTPVFLDGRNLMDSERARRAGFIYMGVGR